MQKNPHLYRHTKRLPSVKELNALSKFEYQYRSVSAEEIDADHYACPKCNKLMQLKKAEYKNAGNVFYLICNDCDMKAKLIQNKKGNMVLVSLPADKETRALRKEVHYYLDIIEKYKIFSSKSQIYQWLTEQIVTYGIGIRHIGEYNAYNCQRAIEECIKCLHNNLDKIPKGFYYYNSPYSSYTRDVLKLTGKCI